MDIIKDLKDIQYLRLDIEYCKEKLDELKSGRCNIKSSSNAGITPGSHVTNPNNCDADILIRIEDLRHSISEKEEKLEKIERRVEDKLSVLEPKERIIIKLHYMNGETFEYICGVIKYSWRHTNRLHKRALEKLKNAS